MPEDPGQELSPTITIKDPLGVEIGVIGRGPLLQLFSGAGGFFAGLTNGTLADLIRDPQALIDQTRIEALKTGLKFDQGHNLVELSQGRRLEYFFDGGVQAAIEFLGEGRRLNGRTVGAGQLATVLSLLAQLDAGLSVPIPVAAGVTISPGVRGGFGLRLSHATLHSGQKPGLQMVKDAISGLSFPFNPERVRNLPEGDVISWRTEATIAFSTRVSWGLSSDVLVDNIEHLKDLEPALQRAQILGSDLNLNSPVAASADLEFVYGISDVFDFKVEKRSGQAALVTVSPSQEEFRQTGFDFTVGLVGLPGGSLEDQLANYLGRQFDKLSSNQLASWVANLLPSVEEALVKRAKLQLKAAFRKTDRRSSSFEFLFDLASPAVREAYAFAVEGDLTKANQAAVRDGSGVRQTLSSFESLSAERLDFVFNFVGVLNFKSQQEMVERSRVSVDPLGELSISHERSFKAIEDVPGHLRIADFLFKAAWNRGQRGGSLGKDFDFQIHYAFTEEERFTSRQELVDTLRLGVALGILSESEKADILEKPVEFSRALNWPILGELTPEDTFGKTSVYIRSQFSEAGLKSILEKSDDEVWEIYKAAFRLANPRSPNSGWLDERIQRAIDEGPARFVSSSSSRERHRRLLIVAEYGKARQFRKTLRIFRGALASGASGEALLREMAEATKAARNFRFDRAAFTALNLLCPGDLRATSLVIDGDKINAEFTSPGSGG